MRIASLEMFLWERTALYLSMYFGPRVSKFSESAAHYNEHLDPPEDGLGDIWS